MLPRDSRSTSAFDPTNIVPSVVAIGLTIVLGRLWYLQIVRGDELSRAAEMRREIRTSIPAPRGMIVDRQGKPLATVQPRLALMIRPDEIQKSKDAVPKLAKLIGEKPAEIQKLIDENSFRRQLPFAAKVGLTVEQAIAIEEQKVFLPGVEVRTLTVRNYPLGGVTAHVVGYVGGVTRDDIERYEANNLTLPSFAGHAGAERRYDLNLVGVPGWEKVSVDSRNRRMGPPEVDRPIPGDRLVLAVDATLQRRATELLQGHRGAIVAIRPSTGEVLCLASAPTFDPNIFTRPLSSLGWRKVGENPKQPLFNRAVSGAFGPGSTFKIVTLIAAIRMGHATTATTFVCDGQMRLGTTTFRCLGNHGRVDYEKALEQSCNIFFAQLALKLDRKKIVEVAEEFGFGSPTGIDLLGERKGVLPWDELIAERNMTWYRGDNMNLSVGQGVVSATPLQMAAYASVLANNGVGYKPTLLLHRSSPPPNESQQSSFARQESLRVKLHAEWWERIRRAMVKVVQSGTGYLAQTDGAQIAGKTGSADWDRNQRSHAWFVGYAPADNPQIAFAIVIEAGGRGGREAAPLARKFVESYMRAY